ncbi:MAG: glycosyltransferase family 4 protein [Spirochaetales bacterium]|nr:glycosyltransferase family 4 protein [Spirochaetales bacterium]
MDPELKKKRLKYFLKSFETFLYKWMLKTCEGFIVLSEDSEKWLERYNKKVFVIPGMVSSIEAGRAITENLNIEKRNYILYSGSLEERYGLKDLLDAFILADIESFDLIICGEGSYREEVENKSMAYNSIKYLGSLPRVEVIELQRNATLLVNPRSTSGDFTRFSFPSKTMEYFLSGSPVLMRPLPGIFPEFEDFVFLDYEQTVESLASSMKYILALPAEEIKIKTRKAIEYIAQTRTESVQTAAFCKHLQLQS